MKSDWLIFFNEVKEKVINSDSELTEEELKKLKEFVESLKSDIDEYQYDLMSLGRLLDYNELKSKGKSKEQISNDYKEDNESIKDAVNIFKNNRGIDHSQMFGYPANMTQDSYLISYFRWLESQMYFMNSCGDAYHPGNYRMNNAEIEIKIIEKMKENLNLPKDKYWGYINSGGTEGNFWGIREGFTRYSNGRVYYSDASHYSVSKFIDMLGNVKQEKISSNLGKIDTNELLTKISENYNKNKEPAILLLTCGTTMLGSVDDVEVIKERLNELKIPHYIHLDGAMYGGIPKNQVNSPIYKLLTKMDKLDLDSISISLHKYIGNSRVNGITLAKAHTNQNYIDYIGQRDVTYLGSRDFPAFSTLQRIRELNDRSNEYDYYECISTFESLLLENNINFVKGDSNGNTFVIDKPSDEICKKYQLSTFDFLGKECAHIIIFPYHKLEDIKCLISDIKNDKIKSITKKR